MVILAYIIILFVYVYCPFLIQVVGFIINAMVPDPIPFLDEVIMIISMWTKFVKMVGAIENIKEFIEEHIVPIVIVVLAIVIVIGIVVYINLR
jgi:hypothetical protein